MQHPTPPAIGARPLVLLSGGLDSAVAVAWLCHHGFQPLALFVDYGQKTADKEVSCARALCAHFKHLAPRETSVPLLSDMRDHAMISSNKRLDTVDRKAAYVPFRNTVLLSLAASLAEHEGLTHVVIGSHASDLTCPDNSPAFLTAFQHVIDVAKLSRKPLEVLAPFASLTKAQIVELGCRLVAPFHLSWSCYNDSRIACGSCGNCRDRLDAFADVGAADPIPYAGPACP